MLLVITLCDIKGPWYVRNNWIYHLQLLALSKDLYPGPSLQLPQHHNVYLILTGPHHIV